MEATDVPAGSDGQEKKGHLSLVEPAEPDGSDTMSAPEALRALIDSIDPDSLHVPTHTLARVPDGALNVLQALEENLGWTVVQRAATPPEPGDEETTGSGPTP